MTYEQIKTKYFPILTDDTMILMRVDEIINMIIEASKPELNPDPEEILGGYDYRLDTTIERALADAGYRTCTTAIKGMQERNIITLRDLKGKSRASILQCRNVGPKLYTVLRDIMEELGYNIR